MGIRINIELENYLIVFDTNVLLKIYRYSPEFADFALKCIGEVKSKIQIPSTVKLEYLKHYRAEFGAMRKKIENAGKNTKSQIDNAKRKVLNTCDVLSLLKFPDIEELKDSLKEKFNEVDSTVDGFFDDRNILELVSGSWGDSDLVYDFFEELIELGNIMSTVSQEEIYAICEEGEKRYKAEPPLPPGYKDKKNKDGVRKYSDLILWKEIIKFSVENDCNIILVTEDLKADWWREGIFHPSLTEEFEKITGNKIIGVNATEFYCRISTDYNVKVTDLVDLALKMTNESYYDRIAEDVFEKIQDDLIFSGEEFIETYSAHIGSESFDELEITDYEFVGAIISNRDDEEIHYEFTYRVTTETTSYEYNGRDDETKKVILSPGVFHRFEGNIIVDVDREVDLFSDFESDCFFETAKLVSGQLIETEYEIYYETEESLEGAYNICPDCGSDINFENDGGNGFCIDCAQNH